MTGRIFVMIFVFWAILTIVTPTLILLSESSKPDLDSYVEKNGELKVRRMMAHAEKRTRIENASAAPMVAPAPAPVPDPVSGIAEEGYEKIFPQEMMKRN